MTKPITVAADELTQGVAFLANNSQLPAFIIASILTDLASEAKLIAQKQLEADNEKWNEYQKSQGTDPPEVKNEDIE